MNDESLIDLQPNCIHRLQEIVYLTLGNESTNSSSVRVPYDSILIPHVRSNYNN